MNTHEHLHTNLSDVLTMVMIKISLQLCRDSFQIGTDHWTLFHTVTILG